MIIFVEGKVEVGKYLFFIILKGIVKWIVVIVFFNICSNGLIVISLKEDDELVNVVMINGN